MLTKEELRAAMSSTVYNSGQSWGTSKNNLWPAGNVAQLRGAVFENIGGKQIQPVSEIDSDICSQALSDVAFSIVTSGEETEYCSLLDSEGKRLWSRLRPKYKKMLNNKERGELSANKRRSSRCKNS